MNDVSEVLQRRAELGEPCPVYAPNLFTPDPILAPSAWRRRWRRVWRFLWR